MGSRRQPLSMDAYVTHGHVNYATSPGRNVTILTCFPGFRAAINSGNDD